MWTAVRLIVGEVTHDVEVTVVGGATVADLVGALAAQLAARQDGPPGNRGSGGADDQPDTAPVGLWIATRWWPPETPLEQMPLPVGACARIGPPPRSGAAPGGRDDGLPRFAQPGATLLAVTEGPAAGRCLELPPAPVTVGRAPDVELRLGDPSVSGRHLRLEPVADATAQPGGGGWRVRDLGSTNGTWLDGRPLLADGSPGRATDPAGRRALSADVPSAPAVLPSAPAVLPSAPVTLQPDDGTLLRIGASHLRLTTVPDDRPVTSSHPATGAYPALGATATAVRPTDGATAAPLAGFGTRWLVNRPPRQAPPAPLGPIDLPAPPRPAPPTRPLPVLAVLAPLGLAAGLVVWSGSARFAMLLLLSPVVALGAWHSACRERRRHRRYEARRVRSDLAELRTHLDVRCREEVARRHARLPDIVEVSRRALGPSTRLWERRPGDPDARRLRVGLGTVAWEPPVRPAPGAGGPPQLRAGAPGSPRRDVDEDEALADWAAEQLDAEVARAARLPRCPVEAPLDPGEVVGIVGDPAAARALARALVVQAVVHHGPADLDLAVLVGDAAAGVDVWRWTAWLPHLRPAAGGPARLAVGFAAVETLVRGLEARGLDVSGSAGPSGSRSSTQAGSRSPTQAGPAGPALLVVVDDLIATGKPALDGLAPDARLLGAAGPRLRALLGGGGPRLAAIVLAPHRDALPATTTTVVTLPRPLADGRWERPALGLVVDDLVATGIAVPEADRVARALAGTRDPEAVAPGDGVPRRVRLVSLLGPDARGPGEILARWATARDAAGSAAGAGCAETGLGVPIGVDAEGPIYLDVVADGPHGLVVGTTGAGKSELLRSLVVGLAARFPPERVAFVLIDYKGGSAFDRCTVLPHTLGVVSDLDGHLGARVLRSLEAELRHRERLLRDAGATDLADYLAVGAPGGPLPRLLVVVDEFATLAAELPDLLGALVGIAQRGRSLGLHLLLATQRPGGSLTPAILANTDLRIALRVHTPADALEVTGVPDAATIRRDTPGRAVLRGASGVPRIVQTAQVGAAADHLGAPRVSLRPLGVPAALADPDDGSGPGPSAGPGGAGAVSDPAAVSDLDLLVDSIVAAAAAGEAAPPRRPWQEPLPDSLLPDDPRSVDQGDPGIVIGVADEPDRQRWAIVRWHPAEGHLGVFGTIGSGTTTTLRSLALALRDGVPGGSDASSEPCHVQVIDASTGALASLGAEAHVGTVVRPGEDEVRGRLLRLLAIELDRRRSLTPDDLAMQPWVVLLVDGVGQVLGSASGGVASPVGVGVGGAGAASSEDHAELLAGLLAQGPALRVVSVLAGARAAELPLRLAGSVGRRLLLRHADPQELLVGGRWPTDLPAFVPGRALDERGREVQVVRHDLSSAAPPGLTDDGAGARSMTPRPLVVGPLPRSIDAAALPTGSPRPEGLEVVVGLEEATLSPAALTLPDGVPIVVAGAPRSGVTTALRLLAHRIHHLDPDALLVAVGPAAAAFEHLPGVVVAAAEVRVADVLTTARDDRRRWVVLVDDAPRVSEAGGEVVGLLQHAAGPRHLLVGGQAEALRAGFGHWTRSLRAARTGILLRPDLAVDGEVLGASLPRRVPVDLAVAGRGFVVSDGATVLAQLAHQVAG